MKVGIDTFGCAHGKSGLGSYLVSLTDCLKNDENVTFELFGPEIDRYTYSSKNGFDYKAVSIPDKITSERQWHVLFANKFARKNKFDAVLYPAAAHMLPLHFRVPGVAVVNDIVSNLIMEKNYNSYFIKHSLKRADKVIVASQIIRKDIERLGIKSNNIIVIHNGINHSEFYPREQFLEDFIDIKPFAIQKPYFIYASRMASPSKKHVELVRAFTLFKERTHFPHRLVLAGSEGECSEAVYKAVYESSAATDIFITGFFPHESFPLLYSNSEGCLFPSVSEGVGLPVLEAMATGVPVACSKSGALTEIAGNNALYFDSDNIEEMADAMEKLASDSALRKKLIEGGVEWSRRFSWEKTAEKTIEVLCSVCNAK